MKKTFLLLISLAFAFVVSAQSRQVSGVVTASDDGSPLTGVSVVVKGMSGVGTITDVDGKFSLKVPDGKSLSFSYIGYTPQLIVINKDAQLKVVLVPDSKMLDEVVAVGYGTMKKSDLTGAVSSVNADKLKKTPVSSIDQALQGRVSGVTVNANSGQPGAAASVYIRGIGSPNGDTKPLYVVDGVIMNGISFLSPSDITSLEVLKDASSTAIYGSRGANGVILVTTKKGIDSPKVNISFDTYFGVQNRGKKINLMKRDEFAQVKSTLNGSNDYLVANGLNKWIESYLTGKKSPYFPKIKTDVYPQGMDYTTVDTDWQDAVFQKDATIQNHHISFDGGTKTSQYAVSASFFDQQGTLIGSNYKRFTLRMNTAFQLRKWLKVGENFSLISSTSRNAMNNSPSAGASILTAAQAMAPWDPTHYPAGSWSYNTSVAAGFPSGRDLSNQISASSNFKNVTNPLSMVQNSVPENKNEQYIGDVFVELTPIKGLTIRSDISMDKGYTTDKLFKYSYLYSAFDKSDKNFFTSTLSNYSTMINENTISYNAKIGKHDFTILGGQTTQEANYYSIGGAGATILNAVPENWLLSKTTEQRTYAGDGISRSRMFSVLGRLMYKFDDKYILTANIRSDGSSRFPDNPTGIFPAFAFAWKLNEESFMKELKNVDQLKLRFGWGKIGNDQIPGKSFIPEVFNGGPTFVDYVLGSNQALANGAAYLTTVNNGGHWENLTSSNIGVDFGFFNGLIAGNLDFFVRDTQDALLTVKGPAQVGNRWDPYANVGIIRNQGVELMLEHKNKIGNVNYNVGFNASFIKNELISLNGGDIIYYDKAICDKGYSLFTFYGYKYDGVFKSDEEALAYKNSKGKVIQEGAVGGDARFIDQNDDGKIDDADRVDIGNNFPDFTYGFNAAADWRGIDLQLFLQGVAGNQIYNAARERLEGKGEESTLSTAMRNVWTTTNPNGTIPNPYGSTNNMRVSSRFVEDGSYLRIKNIQIGYSLPKKLIESMNISRLRIYLSGSNLLTLTKYTGYDPEVGNHGVDYGNYPQSVTFLVGANVSF
ncbi:MAG: TonB-dependent receptor [Paludibacter sp.]|nr:TonB-dependent receptor [Paludibacter sp.]